MNHRQSPEIGAGRGAGWSATHSDTSNVGAKFVTGWHGFSHRRATRVRVAHLGTRRCNTQIRGFRITSQLRTGLCARVWRTCEGSAPARIWPVIMPGMETMPTTFIWFRTGVMATRTLRWMISRVASHRVAPRERSNSILSLPGQNPQGLWVAKWVAPRGGAMHC